MIKFNQTQFKKKLKIINYKGHKIYYLSIIDKIAVKRIKDLNILLFQENLRIKRINNKTEGL
jgi:hypothetical protein